MLASVSLFFYFKLGEYESFTTLTSVCIFITLRFMERTNMICFLHRLENKIHQLVIKMYKELKYTHGKWPQGLSLFSTLTANLLSLLWLTIVLSNTSVPLNPTEVTTQQSTTPRFPTPPLSLRLRPHMQHTCALIQDLQLGDYSEHTTHLTEDFSACGRQ